MYDERPGGPKMYLDKDGKFALKRALTYGGLIFALIILAIFATHYFWRVKPPNTSSLRVLLDSVAKDISAEAATFATAHLRIKEATIEVNLAAELARTETGTTQTGTTSGVATEVHVEATGKGSNSHKLVVVLEREPDRQEAKTDAASSKPQSRGKQ
jgi:hypothetical protein